MISIVKCDTAQWNLTCAFKSYITPGANTGEDPLVGIPSQPAHAKLFTGKRPRNARRLSHKVLEK